MSAGLPDRPVVMVCLAVAGVQTGPDPSGQYLQDYDPEAHGGRGEAQWTRDPGHAYIFRDLAEAHAVWMLVPRSRPLRDDGQPNRPLTCYTVEFVPPS